MGEGIQGEADGGINGRMQLDWSTLTNEEINIRMERLRKRWTKSKKKGKK